MKDFILKFIFKRFLGIVKSQIKSSIDSKEERLILARMFAKKFDLPFADEKEEESFALKVLEIVNHNL